jgi:hypothetical protein
MSAAVVLDGGHRTAADDACARGHHTFEETLVKARRIDRGVPQVDHAAPIGIGVELGTLLRARKRVP